MYTLDELIQQNKEISELSETLLVLIAQPGLRKNHYVCELISRFYDKVWMHLLFEDKSLYTDLLQHSDPDTVQKIKNFHTSARDIKKQFGRHIKQWCHLDMSEQEAEQFSTQMAQVITEIIDRIRVEEEEIIPLVTMNRDLK